MLKKELSECLRKTISSDRKRTEKGFAFLSEKYPKGLGPALNQFALKLERGDSEYGD